MEEVGHTSDGRPAAVFDGWRPIPFLVTVIMIVVTGAIWMIYNPSARQARELAAQVHSLEQEVAALERRQAALVRRREALSTDLGVIEREARRQFGLVKPGEMAVIADPAQVPEKPPAPPAPRRTPWRRYAIYGLVCLLALSVPVLIATGSKKQGAPRRTSR